MTPTTPPNNWNKIIGVAGLVACIALNGCTRHVLRGIESVKPFFARGFCGSLAVIRAGELGPPKYQAGRNAIGDHGAKIFILSSRKLLRFLGAQLERTSYAWNMETPRQVP